ncbi:hypothetical protein KCP77_13170 [Salmonella enterica subsp. enterica]|nr:hypothetical protein KCP77_13170 [Salmonella enterica subsp. enterica]
MRSIQRPILLSRWGKKDRILNRGVENQTQAQHLRQHGVQMLQGYLYA